MDKFETKSLMIFLLIMLVILLIIWDVYSSFTNPTKSIPFPYIPNLG